MARSAGEVPGGSCRTWYFLPPKVCIIPKIAKQFTIWPIIKNFPKKFSQNFPKNVLPKIIKQSSQKFPYFSFFLAFSFPESFIFARKEQ
jgi:hypothetical protein